MSAGCAAHRGLSSIAGIGVSALSIHADGRNCSSQNCSSDYKLQGETLDWFKVCFSKKRDWKTLLDIPYYIPCRKLLFQVAERNSPNPLLDLLLTRVQFRVLLLSDFSHQNPFIHIGYKFGLYLWLTPIFHVGGTGLV